ncbi:MAG: YMGG-like glycine zipper-containing protein [Burkholderiaceae bacterium]
MNTTSKILKLSPLLALLLLGACVTAPTGPSVLVLPGTGKSFDQFREDDNVCKQFATGQIGNTTAGENATDSGVRSAAVGTAIGAVAGAAFGGSKGAGVGAGAGLLMGSAEGSNASRRSAYTTQQRYDNSYIQCMYSYGHRVPVSGRMMTESGQSTRSVPPPPPPGSPPPPPPSAR